MKFDQQFRTFLGDVVNLNTTRLDQLATHVKAITGTLEASNEVGAHVTGTHRQGSWAHGTIIRPHNDREFDADFMVELAEQEDWEPKDYLLKVRAALKASSTYQDKVSLKNRCVRVQYAGDHHVDVVPYVAGAVGGWIVNRQDNEFEGTNPAGFTDWYAERNALTNGHLKRVIRLVKYLRDIKGTFSVKSVILTTLLGERVSTWEASTGGYGDLPTALSTLMDDLASYLEQHPTSPPSILDPSDSNGLRTFDHRWDTATYPNLVEQVRYYADKIAQALDEQDRAKSMALWREVFGDAFGADLQKEMASLASVSKGAMTGAPNEQFIDAPPYSFPIRTDSGVTATITCRVAALQGFRDGDLANLGHQVHRGRTLKFKVSHDADRRYSTTVYWKVRNRGPEAASHGQLRGEIHKDEGNLMRTETTEWHGSHFVEAYVVQNGECVAVARYPVYIV